MTGQELHARIAQIGAEAKFDAVAFALHDYESGRDLVHDADRSFHAASTMKVAILLAVYKLAEEGRLRLDDTLHVRNRFRSLVRGEIFRVAANRDGDNEVHQRLGRSMRVRELARAMITRSSNLATNLLLNYASLEAVQCVLGEGKVTGVKLARGVEDTLAFDAGINNEVTANGLAQMFRHLCEGRFVRSETREQLIEILSAQEFNNLIPAGVPKGTKIAHKTGEISTVCHDAGIVFPAHRKPYAVSILTEMRAEVETRNGPIAQMSREIFNFVTSEKSDE